MPVLDDAEIARVRELHVSLRAVKRCSDCGLAKRVTEFTGYGMPDCRECLERARKAREQAEREAKEAAETAARYARHLAERAASASTICPGSCACVTRQAPQSLPTLLLTPDQAAEACQVSRSQFDEWSFRTGFPVIREGRLVRIPLDDLRAWLADQAALTNTQAATPTELARLPLRRQSTSGAS